MPPMKSYEPTPEDEAFMAALKEQMPPDMPADRILAIVSQFVGQLIALQDEKRFTADQAMQIVSRNIEIGNRAMLLSIVPPEGKG